MPLAPAAAAAGQPYTYGLSSVNVLADFYSSSQDDALPIVDKTALLMEWEGCWSHYAQAAKDYMQAAVQRPGKRTLRVSQAEPCLRLQRSWAAALAVISGVPYANRS